ncbi:hypothetical protein [Streptomyces oceani]|uniref:hypothetical protein n=1 Tax=Streptomyces oceani TaxID=1075402 RepID=UPI001BAE79AD|nr:hypothetical protein [Streptomyces oceani]
MVIATVVILAATILAAILQSSGDEASDRTTSPATPAPSESESATSPPSSAPTGQALPDGYRSVDDEAGFSIAVPGGWTRAGSQNGPSSGAFDVNYANRDHQALIRVFEVSGASPEQLFADLGGREDIHKLGRPEDFEARLLSGQRMEYWIGPVEEGWRVIDSRFEAIDGKVYSVALHTRSGVVEEKRADEIVEVALWNFCPPDVVCGM